VWRKGTGGKELEGFDGGKTEILTKGTGYQRRTRMGTACFRPKNHYARKKTPNPQTIKWSCKIQGKGTGHGGEKDYGKRMGLKSLTGGP